MNTGQPQKRPRLSRAKKAIILLAVMCCASTGAGVFFYLQFTGAQAKINEKDDLVKRVSSIVEVPDESPSIMTVADTSRLQNRQLAAKLSNDDVLLVFAQNHRLVVYRPSTGKVVDILTFSSNEAPTIKP